MGRSRIACVALGIAACTYDVPDVAPQSDDGGASADGAAQPGVDACVQGVGAGWRLVAFAPDRTNACPAGFASRDAVSNPTAAAGACTCTCAVDPSLTCASGTLSTSWGFMPTCAEAGPKYPAAGGACVPTQGSLPAYFMAQPLPASVSCTASAASDRGKVAHAPVRLCDPPPQGEAALCEGAAAPGFAACIETPGDVPCPSPWNVTRTVVGDDVSLTCSGCTRCSATADCTSTAILVYADSTCSRGITALLVDGQCHATGAAQGGTAFGSYEYQATPTNAQCTTTDVASASVALKAARTECCR